MFKIIWFQKSFEKIEKMHIKSKEEWHIRRKMLHERQNNRNKKKTLVPDSMRYACEKQENENRLT